MHDLPDMSTSPTKYHIHIIADFLTDNFGVPREKAAVMARDLQNDLYLAKWEIISKQVMDAVLESGGVDPMLLLGQYDNIKKQGAIKVKPVPGAKRGKL